MDTMTTTKVAAALCGSLLVLLLAKWMATELYHVGGNGEQAYIIEVEPSDDGEGVTGGEVSFEDMLAMADVSKGSKVFKKCSACHKLEDGANSTGPFLYGVVGRSVGQAPGFGYSATLSELGGDWTPERIDQFLAKPSGFAKGTTMGFAGLKKPQDRANVIAYLDSLDD